MALGATRRRIARQLIAESLLLCGLGAIGGVFIAVWAQSALSRRLERQIPLIETTAIDTAVLAFAVLLTVVSAVLCGLAPLVGWRSANFQSRGQTEGVTSMRLRNALVVSEVALAVTLVASAGLFVRTLVKLRAVDVGFRMDRVLTVSMDMTTEPFRGRRGNAARFLEQLIPRLAALPGVQSVAAATGMPLEAGPAEQAITREDRPALLAAASPRVTQTAVTPGYFATIGVALQKGRFCTEADTADGTLVALVNETAARRYWQGEDPIGKRFARGSRERFNFFRAPSTPGAIEWREIVGIVADMRSAGFADDIQPEVYYCYKQFPFYEPRLFVRTTSDPTALAAAVRGEIAAANTRAVVVRMRTLEDVAGESLTNQRLRAALVGAFSALALALGMLGIYGVTAYTVGQRTQEIGIRMALGADRIHVSRMIVSQAFRLTAAGILLGLFGAFAAARSTASLLFGVPPFDAVTFAGTCLLMLGAAILASSAPAWKATQVDPAVALRSE